MADKTGIQWTDVTWVWEQHKPRVWRMRGVKCRVTVAPSLQRREWVWTIDRVNGLGHTSERAHGRFDRLSDAKELLPEVLRIYDRVEVARHLRKTIGGK